MDIATGVLTQHWAAAWWVATAVQALSQPGDQTVTDSEIGGGLTQRQDGSP